MMMTQSRLVFLLVVCLAVHWPSLPHFSMASPSPTQTSMTKVAESEFLWTGIAVTKGKRIFVNFPRWDKRSSCAVAEVLPDRSFKPYPDLPWNSWKDEDPDVGSKFVCVQSVFCDDRDSLWILDSGNPYLKGVLRDAPKLVKVETSVYFTVSKLYLDPAEAVPYKIFRITPR